MSACEDNNRETNRDRLAHFDADRAEAERAVAELESAILSLPPCDKEGRSECVDAETLFAQKEEKTERTNRLLAILEGHVSAMEQAMNRTLNNLGCIRSAESSLHTQAPCHELFRGESAAQDAYRRLATQRGKAVALIKRMTTVINRASQKQWPLGKPRKASPGVIGTDSGGPVTPMRSGSSATPTPPSLAGEIAGIRPTSAHTGGGHNGPGIHPSLRTSFGEHSASTYRRQPLSTET